MNRTQPVLLGDALRLPHHPNPAPPAPAAMGPGLGQGVASTEEPPANLRVVTNQDDRLTILLMLVAKLVLNAAMQVRVLKAAILHAYIVPREHPTIQL